MLHDKIPRTMSTQHPDNVHRPFFAEHSVLGGEDGDRVTSSTTIGDWIGDFFPKTINVIPLFEDKEHILDADKILRAYLRDKSVPYQRVFLARSDPAVNYGQIGAVLLNKIALQRLHKLEIELGIPIYPILGVGSAPFRGNLRPETVTHLLNGYPSVQTFTIQSSFKFDNPPDAVRAAVQTINDTPRRAPMAVDEEKLLPIIEKYTAEYIRQLTSLVGSINSVARYIPKRRKRKRVLGLISEAKERYF